MKEGKETTMKNEKMRVAVRFRNSEGLYDVDEFESVADAEQAIFDGICGDYAYSVKPEIDMEGATIYCHSVADGNWSSYTRIYEVVSDDDAQNGFNENDLIHSYINYLRNDCDEDELEEFLDCPITDAVLDEREEQVDKAVAETPSEYLLNLAKNWNNETARVC